MKIMKQQDLKEYDFVNRYHIPLSQFESITEQTATSIIKIVNAPCSKYKRWVSAYKYAVNNRMWVLPRWCFHHKCMYTDNLIHLRVVIALLSFFSFTSSFIFWDWRHYKIFSDKIPNTLVIESHTKCLIFYWNDKEIVIVGYWFYNHLLCDWR